MHIKHYIGFTYLAISSMLISMDQPPSLALNLVKKSSPSINFDDDETAFKQLTANNACVLRTLIAREQRGKYCPDLYKAQKPLALSLSSDYMHWSFKLDSDTSIFIRQVEDKHKRYKKLISILSYKAPHEFLEQLPTQCQELLERNRYAANTYGSSEPYQDRIITPLHYVLTAYADKLLPDFCPLSFCNMLLHSGANPNARDDAGNTPMHHASTPEQVRLLCEYGAKLNTKGDGGRTPLLNGIRLRNWPVVKCLLQHGANPNIRDDKGTSPLRMAIKKNKPKIVKLLLDSGADWSQETFSGFCPIYIYDHIIAHRIEKDLKELLQKNDVETIKQLINTPCIHEMDLDNDHLIAWIKQECIDTTGTLFPAADILIKHFEERENFHHLQFINDFADIMEKFHLEFMKNLDHIVENLDRLNK